MGTDYHTYIGPFVTAHNPPMKSQKEHFGCNNNLCRQHLKECSSKFCPDCGRAIVLVSVPCTEVRHFDVYDECKEKLSKVYANYFPKDQQDYEIYIPNIRGFGQNLDGRSDGGFHSYNETIVADETSRFMGMFRKELEKICKFFGSDKVAFHWGVIQYTS